MSRKVLCGEMPFCKAAADSTVAGCDIRVVAPVNVQAETLCPFHQNGGVLGVQLLHQVDEKGL